MTRAVIYRRVSTQGQAGEDRYSLQEQETKCRAYCENQGYEVVEDFAEKHTGAEFDERPRLSELREMARRGLLDVVVATNFDRISRNQIHQHVILYQLGLYDVTLELTEEHFEDDADGDLQRTLKGYFAQMEREKTRDRTMRGKRQRVREGLIIPGNSPLYGYLWADKRKSRYIINPKTAPIVQRIWNESASGTSIRRIADSLTADGIPTPKDSFRLANGKTPHGEAWARTTVRNVLTTPAYYGQHSAFRMDYTKRRRDRDPISGVVTKVREVHEREIDQGRIALPDSAPQLVSEELARIVRERLANNKLAASRNNKYPEQSLLRGGYAKCGLCGGNLIADYTGPKRADNTRAGIYKCSRSVRRTNTGERACPGVRMMQVELDSMVWEDILTLLRNPDYLMKEMRRYMDAHDTDNSH